MVKSLKYPSSIIENKDEKKIRYAITFLVLVMIVPSFYLAYNLLNEKKFTKTAELFIQKEFENKGYTVIYKKLIYNAAPKVIDLAFLNKHFSPEEIWSYNSLLQDNGLQDTRLSIRQDSSSLKSEILKEISKNTTNISEKDVTISQLRRQLDQYRVSDSSLIQEIQILYPDMKDISYGKTVLYPNTDSARLQFTLLYTGKEVNRTQLNQWLAKRLKEKNITLINYRPD